MSIATWSSRIAATISSLPPRLLRIYRETRYEAGGIAVRIGRRSAAMDHLLRQLGSTRGGFITAWNPASRLLPEGINRRRQKRLVACLRRHPSRPALGSLRGWREEHLLVAADHRILAGIARRDGQNAIVLLRTGEPARLLILP
jgi:hypothetical protein